MALCAQRHTQPRHQQHHGSLCRPGQQLRPLMRQRCRTNATQKTVSVHDVTDATFQQEVLECELPVLVDFWAPWCGPCRVVAPIVEQLAAQYEGRLKCVKVNTADSGCGTAFELSVKSIPTVMLFKDGRKQDVIVGAVPKATFEEAINKVL